MVPEAHATNANLFVSAENSQFDNYMSGPQVIEVVVINDEIDETDKARGEPDVTVNGKKLRMAQANDGNWYGYFADKTMATTADQTTTASTLGGRGLDFGQFCGSTSTALANDESEQLFSDTVGVAIPVRTNATAAYGVNGTTFTNSAAQACTQTFEGATAATGSKKWNSGTDSRITANATHTLADATESTTTGLEGTVMNVVREAKTLNTDSSVTKGQIQLKDDGLWPFIQLYDLTAGGNVDIQYNKGGGIQSTTLTFDTVDDYATASLDRSIYPRDSQVHVTINDVWLNIDPTDEDSWTFEADTTPESYYQLFDENGGKKGDNEASGAIFLSGNYSSLMNADSLLKITADAQSTGTPVVTLQDNADTVMLTCTTAALCSTAQLAAGTIPVTLTETAPNSGVFTTYDSDDKSIIKITGNALRGTSATIDYNDSAATILVGFDFATIDIQPVDDEWNSGEEIPVILTDFDANKNTRADEDLKIETNGTSLLPSIQTGNPFTFGDASSPTAMFAAVSGLTGTGSSIGVDSEDYVLVNNKTADRVTVDSFSDRANFQNATNSDLTHNALVIDLNVNIDSLYDSIGDSRTAYAAGEAGARLHGFNFLNLGLASLNSTNNATVDVYLLNNTDADAITALSSDTTHTLMLANDVALTSVTNLNNTTLNQVLFEENDVSGNHVGLLIVTNSSWISTADSYSFVADFFSFGFTNDGEKDSERVSNQIVRLQLEESGDNTSTFEGTLEYVMLNQLNILDPATYTGLSPISDEATFIVMSDSTDEDSVRVNYFDLGSDGVSTQIADQEEAPSHSGIVSLDNDNYKQADTVVVTLEDLDLNTDSSLIDIYTTIGSSGADVNKDQVGSDYVASVGMAGNTIVGGATGSSSIALSTGSQLGRMLDITFDDARWTADTDSATCSATLTTDGIDTGLAGSGFTLVESGVDTGVFNGDFQVPSKICKGSDSTSVTATGLDIEVNYVDFRDASGAIIEVGDGAGIRANTGSVSLDRTVYPVPFGVEGNFDAQSTVGTPNGRSLFPIHQTGTGTDGLQTGEYIADGDLTIHVRVNDPDFDISASGEDKIQTNSTSGGVGPVKVSVIRGSSSVILGHAGGPAALDGRIAVGTYEKGAVQFGPMVEIAPDAGIFESDITLRYTDGPANTTCDALTTKTDGYTSLDGDSGTTEADRFDTASASDEKYCILQGDILQVEYTDPADASGSVNTVTDSATFDLRNGVLQSDKSVYIIGSDMILTLIEPDFDLDNDSAETYDLDLIEWDDGDSTLTMGSKGDTAGVFDPEPSDFRETGDSTGIFQIVIEIPSTIGSETLDRGQQIDLEYTDWGPSGSDYVGDEDEDMNTTVYTSNFGATVELDQKVYTWTDKIYITIVAPDHNFDSDLIDNVGETTGDIIKVSTRSYNIKQYKLVETGTDTGIFTGEVILTGFSHDADGDLTTGTATNGYDTSPSTSSGTSNGPTDGKIQTDNEDGLTVSFEYTEDETVVGSALIRWNIGEVQWLEASYPASGTGVVRIIDPDMNWDPEAVDNFNVDLWSDSDAGGIDLTVTETNEATGIFEGTVFFTTTDESSGHRLRVSEGDTVTAEYEDNTLPAPYTTADELDVTATSLIGTVVPPLERAPAANLRTVDAFGNSLDAVSIDQQVQLTADLANGQDKEQSFAYLVQIQNSEGVTVSLAWITGSLSSGQSFSPALSWIPTEAGSYTATAFVWESVDNPTALSPSVSTTVNVR